MQGGQVIEIVVRENLDKSCVIRKPGKLPEIHIGADMSLSRIENDLGSEISTAEFEKFKKLYCDDSYPRVFTKSDHYLKISDKN